ncbi:hypothetical protein SFC11_07685 [Exiguobacterium indicum]|uniref:hypothetical protein n=1 Tax=Exiguobacterium indicum TaxID=296995 RepID=UPI003982A28D
MKSSTSSANILCLLKFFFNDTFHGLFNRPFFKSRVNRYGLAVLLICIYLGYFYLNMVQLSSLSTNAVEADKTTRLLAGKMTLSSYFNVVFILGTFMFILINATVSLNRNSLFFAKTLPFSEREVNISQRLFKLCVALVFFELLMIIVAPALKLIPMQWGTALLVLLSLHTVFIASFWLLDCLHAAVLQRFSGIKRSILSFVLDLVLIGAVTFHLMKTRFQVDLWVSTLSYSILTITLLVLLTSLAVGGIAYLLHAIFFARNHLYVRQNYFKLGLPAFNIGLATTMPAIIRSKNFLYFWALLAVMSVGAWYQVGWEGTFQLWLFLFPVLGVVTITYADATLAVRKVYGLYRIHPLMELASLFGVAIILMAPALYIGIVETNSLNPYMYGINIFFAATIAGFLFPKSQSNINETIASVLTIILIVLLSVLVSIDGALYPALAVLLSVLYLILKKEYEVAK